jgi:hypothetical protein
VNARERVNTVVVTVIKGDVTAKLIEEEFARILLGVWRWTARKVVVNKFLVRFPSAQLIKDWNRFNPISLRAVKAKVMVEPWNGSVGAKGELQEAWFRVRGFHMISGVRRPWHMWAHWLVLLEMWINQL